MSGSEIDAAARTVWAKSQHDDNGSGMLTGWLPLWQHLDDTAGVAGKLWDFWLSDAVRCIIAEPFDADQAVARALYIWLAGSHDAGKSSAAFASKVPQLAGDMARAGFTFAPGIEQHPDRHLVRHEVVSHLACVAWLENTHGFERDTATQYGSILAAHHGLPPDSSVLDVAEERWDTLVGDGLWAQARAAFFDRAARRIDTDMFERFRKTTLPTHVQALLSGIVIVADWLASNEEYFPYAPLGSAPQETTANRLAAAWRKMDLPAPWHPRRSAAAIEQSFAASFGLPAGATMRPIQRELVAVASTVPQPRLMILEADMGSGKTEAALAAAEVLAARFGLGGVFVGLPTQATADGMFTRMLEWAKAQALATPNNVYLAHGKNALNEQYAALRSAAFHSIGEDSDTQWHHAPRTASDAARAHYWFSDPKRGPLSNLVVGTIDQGLFVGLRSRHAMLRHLALAGKVVIIDEAHAYSDFMNVYAERMLHWLAAYGVPVIVLTATLPAERRRALVEAYNSGHRAAHPRSDTDAVGPAAVIPRTKAADDIGYPAITVSNPSGPAETRNPEQSSDERTVRVVRANDSDDVLIALLRENLGEGGCAVVIRNTVRRVQQTARLLRSALPDIPVTVAHSRFLGLDRAEKDRALIRLFGKPGDGTHRPQRHIVVASQVVEQSLDIDFDIMISDLAPIDLLLQRAGRLHRHRRGPGEAQRSPRLREATLIITGVSWSQTPPLPAHDYAPAIYPTDLLYRTLAVLKDRDSISLPADIPELVQRVYGPDALGPDAWHEVMSTATREHENTVSEKRHKAEAYLLQKVHIDEESSLIGWVSVHSSEPDDRVGQGAVRDGAETLEVIMLEWQQDGVGLQTPSWVPGGGVPLPFNEPPNGDLIRVILGCSLRLPRELCRPTVIDGTIALLEQEFRRLPLGTWHTVRRLRGELVVVFDRSGTAQIGDHTLHYSNDIGLEVRKHE